MKQVNPIKFHLARLVRLTRNAIAISLLSVIAIGFLTTSSLAAGFDTATIGPRSNLQDAILDGVNLSQKDVSDSYLNRASLVGANLSGANLSGSIFHQANLSKANLSGADLRQTVWSALDKDVAMVMFSELLTRLGISLDSNYRPGEFDGLMLQAYLGTLHLTRTEEYYAGIESYPCGYPDVQCLQSVTRTREVSLPNAEAKLTDADFSNADLRGAFLKYVNLSGVKLSGAIYDAKTAWPQNFDPSKVGAILK